MKEYETVSKFVIFIGRTGAYGRESGNMGIFIFNVRSPKKLPARSVTYSYY